MMKKTLAAASVAICLTACDKIQVKQTTETIESLNKGYRTLDSLSVVLNDSARTNEVFRRQKDIIEKQIDLKHLKISNPDSVAAALKKISENTAISADAVKSLDSARRAIKNSDDPFAAIGTITKTLNKALRSNNIRQVPAQDSSFSATQIYEEQLKKRVSTEIEVDDVSAAKSRLNAIVNQYGGEVTAENFSDNDGQKIQRLSVRIPAENFDRALQETQQLGAVTARTMESSGSAYNPSAEYELSVALHQNSTTAGNYVFPTDSISNRYDQVGEEENSGWSKYLYLLFLLPILIVALLIWYFTARNRRKKRDLEMQKIIQQQKIICEQMKNAQKPEQSFTPKETRETPPKTDDPDDYSRFMPK